MYYAKLIAVLNDLERRAIQPDNFMISKIISDTTIDIIQTEFISEFKNYCKNLVQVLDNFKGSKQIIEYGELEYNIGRIDFNFVIETLTEKDNKKKIEFLFDIGFIGIEVSDNVKERYKLLINDIFCFNERNRTFESLYQSDFDECRFIIHPIFCEYLGLDTSTQERLVLDINWDYIVNQELFMRS